ncbi:isochorismatase family protein [Streptomyces sp. NPDC050534]
MDARSRRTSRRGLVLVGFMTHPCVNSTARDAFNLRCRPTA